MLAVFLQSKGARVLCSQVLNKILSTEIAFESTDFSQKATEIKSRLCQIHHWMLNYISFIYFLKRTTIYYKGPSTLATLFNHMWPRIVADPSTLGRHVAATCMLCMQTLCLWRGRATACRTLEPQTAVCTVLTKA